MFYIKFKGYKKEKEKCTGLFFVGRIYTCGVVDSNMYYQTQDENGNIVKFQSIFHDDCYDFSRIDTQSKVLDEHDNKMKYRMNGVDVTKSFFDDKLLEVELLKSRGVSVFIDFEVYFE
ncbi:putative tail fiber protein [Escherichia phage vB_EcoD_SU57]|uniref:Putative tail fiber protein n=1 Tax=Escherichia phage vB_EcoD_SU57 TaxID=2743969 RepID=A0A7D5JU83_9CAUD|nr:putative tail fiber protein [Escherichia phage vB_EcoD_SU57]